MSESEISQSIPASPASAGGIQITLQVGERRFVTTRATLMNISSDIVGEGYFQFFTTTRRVMITLYIMHSWKRQNISKFLG